MPFGLSFGAKKKSSSSTSEINKNELTTQVQDSSKVQSGVTESTSVGTTQNTGATTNQSVGRTAQDATGRSTGVTEGVQQLFSGDVLTGLESLVGQLLTNTPASSGPAVAFDSDSFIRGGVDRASSRQRLALENGLNQLTSRVGGTASGNSATAILANQLRGDAAANIAGVESDFIGRANEIENRNIQTGIAQSGQSQQYLTQLLAALKGGTATTQNQEVQTNQTSQAATNVASEAGTQTQTQVQQQQSIQSQQLVEALSQLLQGSTNTTGTEKTKGKETSGGGGFSFGFG